MLLYRYFHFFSLDIVLGAAASGYLASSVLNVEMGFAWWVSLCLTVWILYLLDHWLDAKRFGELSPRRLHKFIWYNSQTVLYIVLIASVCDILVILLFLQRELILPGLIIGGFVMIIYFLRHMLKTSGKLRIPLEIFTMVFYVAGIWFGPVRMHPGTPSIQVYAILLQFGLMVLMNIATLSYYDYPVDQVLKSPSMAETLGKRFLKSMVWILGIVVMLLLFLIIYSTQERELHIGSIAIAAMGMLMLCILLIPSAFGKNERYRIAADSILYLGWLPLFI
jgi:hypothetical protein